MRSGSISANIYIKVDDPISSSSTPPRPRTNSQKTPPDEAAKAAGKDKKQLQLQGASNPDALINFRQLRVFGVQAGDLDLYDGDDITKVGGWVGMGEDVVVGGPP